jgi:hypothetical protein
MLQAQLDMENCKDRLLRSCAQNGIGITARSLQECRWQCMETQGDVSWSALLRSRWLVGINLWSPSLRLFLLSWLQTYDDKQWRSYQTRNSYDETERRSRVVNTPTSYLGGSGFDSRPQRRATLIVVLLNLSGRMPGLVPKKITFQKKRCKINYLPMMNGVCAFCPCRIRSAFVSSLLLYTVKSAFNGIPRDLKYFPS